MMPRDILILHLCSSYAAPQHSSHSSHWLTTTDVKVKVKDKCSFHTSIILAEYSPNHNNDHAKQCFTSKNVIGITQPHIWIHFKTLSSKRGQNARHQNLLTFCPESEYYNQNGNFDPQHSAKLIDVTHVLAFHLMRKQKDFLCSLCPNPRRRMCTSLIAHHHKRSTIVWLTANVVDCYVARTTALCSSLGESISFGCIESCFVGQMLCEKK